VVIDPAVGGAAGTVKQVTGQLLIEANVLCGRIRPDPRCGPSQAILALVQGATVHVLTRSPQARELALELGATSVGGATDAPPESVDSAIIFAPAGELVPPALAAVDRGGSLALAGIHLTDIPALHYQQHLFQERQIRSVTANTRQDGHDFLCFAAEHPLHVVTTPYPLDQADTALTDLAADRVHGAAVVIP